MRYTTVLTVAVAALGISACASLPAPTGHEAATDYPTARVSEPQALPRAVTTSASVGQPPLPAGKELPAVTVQGRNGTSGWWARQKRFAAEIAVLSALGGANPNAAYRALMSKSCSQRNRIADAAQLAAANADCERLTGIEPSATTARNGALRSIPED